MANSKYEYVRAFEQPDVLLANTWIVVRIDGRGFSKLTTKYKFVKPNDRRALDLMNAAALGVMKEIPDLVLAYGVSDEFSFVFHKDCSLFERRSSKLTSTIVSSFTSYYTYLWPTYFPDTLLTPPLPSFDGRAVTYPSDRNLRDYMSWRQADCHINNLYNTTFWALVQQGGMDPRSAERELSGSVSSDKNEILFSRFGINYNNEPDIYKKGSVLYRDLSPSSSASTPTPSRPSRSTASPPLAHPKPRQAGRPISQPLSLPILPKSSTPSDSYSPHGPTFLSTSTTPSPPVSATEPSFPISSFPQTFFPISPPTMEKSSSVQKPGHLPQLTPLPIPPPTLAPSTKPPASLNPPNPTTMGMSFSSMTSTAPLARRASHDSPSKSPAHAHSASASASMTPSKSQRPASSSGLHVKHRSPSLSILEGGPPQIPLRISSIPINQPPKKLNLSRKSSRNMTTNSPEMGGSHMSSSTIPKPRASPPTPMSTMKELPSPPTDDPTSPAYQPRSQSKQFSSNDPFSPINNTSGSLSGIGTARPGAYRSRSHSHTRIGSAPVTSYFPPSSSQDSTPRPNQQQQQQQQQQPHNRPNTSKRQDTASPPSPSDPAASPPNSSGWNATFSLYTDDLLPPPATETEHATHRAKSKKKAEEILGFNGEKVISKTQKEKERKKKGRARIVIEHVDVIRDEFWEKRNWILSGRAG